MTVKIDEAAKRCEIHIARHESTRGEEYRETVRRYRAQGYRICVFSDGSTPSLPVTAAQQEGFF